MAVTRIAFTYDDRRNDPNYVDAVRPPGTQAGDLLLLATYIRNGFASAVPGAGWVEAAPRRTSQNITIQSWYRFAENDDPISWRVTTSTTFATIGGLLVTYRGVDGDDPIVGGTSFEDSSAVAGQYKVPEVDSVDQGYVLSWYAFQSSSAPAAPPPGEDLLISENISQTGGGSFAGADGETTAPNTPLRFFTSSATTTISRAGLSVALRPGDAPSGDVLKIWDGAEFVSGTPKIWDGSQWVPGVPRIWDGSQWVPS